VSSAAQGRPGDTAPTIPATIYVKVSTHLLGELGEWSDPVRVKAEQQPDDTYELIFKREVVS
jgi:hypothetical protein